MIQGQLFCVVNSRPICLQFKTDGCTSLDENGNLCVFTYVQKGKQINKISKIN